jgi:hypothetical protein
VGYFCNFQKFAQSKPSPIGRKIAQSGHPAGNLASITQDEEGQTHGPRVDVLITIFCDFLPIFC